MGNPARQWQLRWQNVMLNLNAAPYTVLSASGGGGTLDIEVRVEDATAVGVDRHISRLRQLVRAGEVYSDLLSGGPLYVHHKRCDDLEPVAELGATWRRARVLRGRVQALASAAPHLVQIVRLALELGGEWRRAAPSSVLSGSNQVSARSDGGLTANGVGVTARRLRWTSATGVTARYHWLYGGGNCTFFKVNGTCRAWWDEAAKRFKMQDNATATAQSSTYSFSPGQEVEVVFRWTPGAGLAIFVNGAVDGNAGSCAFAEADPYTLFEPTGSQTLLNAQVWPAALTDAQCTGLAAWGRPDAELAFYVAPANGRNTNQAYRIYNAPGETSAALRLILNDATQAYDKVRLGLRPLGAPATVAWEVEAGTLGAATAMVADGGGASAGLVARFTPADADWATRATLTLAQDPDDLATLWGEHRLFLAGRDQASAPGINLVRWRLVVAGQAEAWSAEHSLAVVNTYSLADLGRCSLPPGSWPDESAAVQSDVYTGAYVTLELQVRNTVGAGGGTLDLDAVYLAPAEREGQATAETLTTGQFLVLDGLSRQPTAVAVADWRQMEFAGWAAANGDALALALEPGPGAGSLLWLYMLRDTLEQAVPHDSVTVQLQMLPGWEVG